MKSNSSGAIPLSRRAQGGVPKFADSIAETHPSSHTTQRAPSQEGNNLRAKYSKYKQTNKNNGPARFPS
jgi:hypothetical protein